MSNLYPKIFRTISLFKCEQVRFLPRWSHRHPVRVILPEEYDKSKDIQIRKTKEKTPSELNISEKINWTQPKFTKNKDSQPSDPSIKPLEYKIKTQNASKPLTISKTKKLSNQTVDMLEAIVDKEGNFIYTKMKNNDLRISSILVEVKSKKEKEKRDLILLEGKRLIKDALNAGCKLEYIVFSRMNEVEYLRPFLPKLGAKLYKMSYKEMQMWSTLTTNPGIMGIFKIPDTESFTPCADSLALTIICDNVREPNNLGAILRTCSGIGCEKIILTKGCANVWDTKVVRGAMGAHFKLQIKKKLNWEEIKEHLPSDSSIFIADNNMVSAASDNNSSNHDIAELVQTVPILPYYSVDFSTSSNIVLIIGGETEGISEEAYKLTSELKGIRLNVPLSNNIDSLNTGTALGVIGFEMKRQLLIQ